MSTGVFEAIRLIREGRLAEATAMIQDRLRGGHPQRDEVADERLIDAELRVVDPAQTTQPPTGAAPNHVAREADATAAAESKPRRVRGIAVGPTQMPHLAGLPLADLLKTNLKAGTGTRQVPAEAICPAGGRWIEATHTSVHGSRAYKLYVPANCDDRPLPLLVMLHGCTQDPDDFAAGTAMNLLAETGKLLVAYPAQPGTANMNRCWNWFQPGDQRRDSGEPALIAGITRQVMAEYTVDPNRVYVAGMSAGGAMAAIMAATYPDLYAAVGVHSGLPPGSAHDLPSAYQAMQQGAANGIRPPASFVPLILFHGDQDHTVHPRNAEQLVRQWAAIAHHETAGAERPRARVSQDRSGGGRAYTCAVYQDGNGKPIVEWWIVHGARHAWSGGSRNGSYTDPAGPNASRELVRFFLEHPQDSPAQAVAG